MSAVSMAEELACGDTFPSHADERSSAAPDELDGSCREVARAELDEACIEACRRGEPLALRRFVVRYQHTVFALLSRMLGGGPQVEDLAQEVFLRAYRALPRYEQRPGARMSTWLLTIAVRLVLDERKRRAVSTVPLDDSAHAQAPREHRTPEHERRRREIGEAVERAASELTQEQRLVFVLAHFHDMGTAEIAEMLGVPENTVKTRLFRARQRLRELLRETLEEDQ